MEMKFREPKVEFINGYNEKLYAWQQAKPHLHHTESELTKVERMDIPVNCFASYVFHVTSSILFRDIFFTLRPLHIWARSFRDIPFNAQEIFVSKEYEGMDNEYYNKCFESMFNDLANGVPQDHVKKGLPMATSTEYTVSIDDRTLIAFLTMLKIHNKDLYEVYGKLFLDAIGKDEDYLVARGSADIFYKYALTDNEYGKFGVTTALDMVAGSYELSNNLMAQFLRQHYSKVKNGLLNQIDGCSLKDLAYVGCDDMTQCVVYADKPSFDRLVSIRSCAFAQYDKEDKTSWSSVIGPYVETMTPEEFLNVLPCQGKICKCACALDMKSRTNNIDVNPPCPILHEDPSLVKYREEVIKSDSKVHKAWVKLAESGLINDNPENEDRLTWERIMNR